MEEVASNFEREDGPWWTEMEQHKLFLETEQFPLTQVHLVSQVYREHSNSWATKKGGVELLRVLNFWALNFRPFCRKWGAIEGFKQRSDSSSQTIFKFNQPWALCETLLCLFLYLILFNCDSKQLYKGGGIKEDDGGYEFNYEIL
jgi:hypothetical protein